MFIIIDIPYPSRFAPITPQVKTTSNRWVIDDDSPLVNVYITVVNHHFYWVNHLIQYFNGNFRTSSQSILSKFDETLREAWRNEHIWLQFGDIQQSSQYDSIDMSMGDYHNL